MVERQRYWFRRKRFGWGWGLPVRWQGWLAMALFIGALALAKHFFFTPDRPMLFSIAVIACIAAFAAVCWLKGEPPKWSWGGDD